MSIVGSPHDGTENQRTSDNAALQDAAQQTIYFSNQVVTANADYSYDARYRLISAASREHLGNNRLTSTAVGALNEPYRYDPHGNMTQMLHFPYGFQGPTREHATSGGEQRFGRRRVLSLRQHVVSGRAGGC